MSAISDAKVLLSQFDGGDEGSVGDKHSDSMCMCSPAAPHCGPVQLISSSGIMSDANSRGSRGATRVLKCHCQPLHWVAPPAMVVIIACNNMVPSSPRASPRAAMACREVQYEQVRAHVDA